MIPRLLLSGALMLAAPVCMAEQRQLHAHEHGAGTLDIARAGTTLEFELRAPGADIVGFEHPATSPEDQQAVVDALEVLSQPDGLLAFPPAAGCEIVNAKAQLVVAGTAQEMPGSARASDGTGDTGHDDHDDHDDAGPSGHTEFHANASFTCADPAEIDRIDFPYFERFPNARRLEIQAVSDKGGFGAEVDRDRPVLVLDGKL